MRAGLRLILDAEDGVEIVGEAATTDEAWALIERDEPDVLFLDISLPSVGGIELTRRLKEEHPDTRVIILTLHESEDYFTQALQAGARGYLVKGSRADELLAALNAVRDGGTYLNAGMATGLVASFLEARRSAAFAGLSEREIEVAELLIEGLHNQEIALRLNVQPTTVQTHRSHVMEKLGLKDYGELIRYAIRNGVTLP